MEDLDVVTLCRQFLRIYRNVTGALDLQDCMAEIGFADSYSDMISRANVLAPEAIARWLDAAPYSGPLAILPLPSMATEQHRTAIYDLGSAVSLLLKVADAKALPNRRKLVALIHRFLKEVGSYLSWAGLIELNSQIVATKRTSRPASRTLAEMSIAAREKPSQADLDRIVESDRKKHASRAALVDTADNLAVALTESDFDSRGVLQVRHRADAGGGPRAVLQIWEEVKIALQQVLIKVSIEAAGNDHRQTTNGDSDLMTREEIAAVTGIGLQTLKNQSARFLGPPAVAPGKGRGRKKAWHYLAIKSRLEGETGNSMPMLEDAKRVIANKQNV
jgi:hypothetical protein